MPAEPYARFAGAYDTPEHHQHSRAFFHKVRMLTRGCPVDTYMLDLGCGTGNIAEAFAKAGRRAIGIDRSPKMLAIARRRNRRFGNRVTFKRADLTSFRVNDQCVVATACGDVVNHLASIAKVGAMFRRTHESLVPGGLFAFDSLGLICFERFWAEQTYYMEGAGGDLVMECDWNAATRVGIARIIAYERRGNGRFYKSETTLTEYFYSDGEIRSALRSAGFRRIRREPWDPWFTGAAERPVLDRNFWIAAKGR